jgi:hypothetical protein
MACARGVAVAGRSGSLVGPRGQEMLSLSACLKSSELLIIGAVLRGISRTKRDEFVVIFGNDFGEIITVVRRHMPCAAMRAVVVAHAGPLVRPRAAASSTLIMVAEPSHRQKSSQINLAIANDSVRGTQIQDIRHRAAFAVAVEFCVLRVCCSDRAFLIDFQMRTPHQG